MRGSRWDDLRHSAQSQPLARRLVASFAATGVPRNQVRVTETLCSLVPCKNLLDISLSSSWVSKLGLRRRVQEVSHRGRKIDGLEVWAATVTVSLQDGCGFAD